ncbi:H/ACA ribonucleoprotein complex non-core subunit NAF1 [Manduca sexta]|uniref:H/ACA ribonucleoprotein complex non-core subunit NAF1 n=1 Tax=Manduca sexta TaxID=7130 RepID=UPI00188FDF22|nr:H/ACA ribonucleoprotein complex non-core subunit NAF1 [Manduca sexta]
MESPAHSNNKNVSLSLIAEYGASDSDSDDTETRSNEYTGNEDSDAPELSEMVLKNNIINACAHGPLSRPKAREVEQTTRHMIIDSSESGVVEYEVTEYRDLDTESESSSSSDSSDSEVDSVKDVEEASSSGDELEPGGKTKIKPLKVTGELGLDELPPIEDLAISLPAQECTRIGTITSIVERLVVVRALPATPAVDIDTVLFVDNGAKALGKVFDVFGPVTEPYYCVRFNSQEHVKERGVQTGMDVYIAPNAQHTSYVFLSDLMKLKGSDASWLNDVEPPSNHVDYSDDEEERKANRLRKEKACQNAENSENDDSPSRGTRKPERRGTRPSESSSRFGSGPSRARNPFSLGSRRSGPNFFPRFARPWGPPMDLRTPPPHPSDPAGYGPYSAPPFASNGARFLPPFNPSTPPPFQMFQFGNGPRIHNPAVMGVMPPLRHNAPVFGSNFCNGAGPHPQWANNATPPPPGT